MGNSVIYRPAYDAEVEYLESDGNSYIDTGLKASSELGILAHIYVIGAFPFGGRNGLNNKEFSFCAVQQDGNSGFQFGSGGVLAQGERVNELYEFDNTQNHNILKVGNTSYVTTYNSFISDYNVFLFGLNNAGTVIFSSSRIYDFKIYQNSTLVRDYIPVRIGQVGYMYDKVSKQLFANKGTGNFVLGNDVSNAVIPQQRCVLYFGNQRSVVYERIYEEYEWLKADIPISTSMMRLPINSKNFEFKRNWIQIMNSSYFTASNSNNTYVYYIADIGDRNALKPRIWDRKNTVDAYISLRNLGLGIHTIVANDNEVVISSAVNTATLPWYGNPEVTLINNSNNIDKNTIHLTSSIKVDGVIRYVPCKLLQPIPATLDGNGIARQAGECGMWDKVSNKFYGNVANSGSFSVSN